MNFNDAQFDMRQAYFGGGPGVFASGIVWVIAGLVALLVSAQASLVAIFIGGMFIHPLGMVLSKLLKRSGKHQPENPLGRLAIETTFLLFIGLFIAFAASQIDVVWFFPIMLLIIGGRYLMFTTLYGLRIYWGLGGLLAIAGIFSLIFLLPASTVAFTGGIIEIIFAGVITKLESKG